MNRNSNFVWVIVVLLIIIGLIYWVVNSSANRAAVTVSPSPTVTATPIITPLNLSTTATSTVNGEYVCLPHRDTSGPTTLECAFGLKVDNGDYYALNTSMLGTTTIDSIETGNRVRVEGRLGTSTPAQMNTYNIEGLIMVGDIDKI